MERRWVEKIIHGAIAVRTLLMLTSNAPPSASTPPSTKGFPEAVARQSERPAPARQTTNCVSASGKAEQLVLLLMSTARGVWVDGDLANPLIPPFSRELDQR